MQRFAVAVMGPMATRALLPSGTTARPCTAPHTHTHDRSETHPTQAVEGNEIVKAALEGLQPAVIVTGETITTASGLTGTALKSNIDQVSHATQRAARYGIRSVSEGGTLYTPLDTIRFKFLCHSRSGVYTVKSKAVEKYTLFILGLHVHLHYLV